MPGLLNPYRFGAAIPTYTHAQLTSRFDASAITGKVLNDPITTLADVGAGQASMDQANSSHKPLYIPNSQNGLPILRFDSTDWLESNTTLRQSTQLTLAMAGKRATTAGTGIYFSMMAASPACGCSFGHQSTGRIAYTRGVAVDNQGAGTATTNWERWVLACGPASTKLWVNGTLVINTSSQMVNMNQAFTFRIGASEEGTQFGTQPSLLSTGMDMGECLTLGTAANSTEAGVIDAYLLAKWG